MKKILKFFFGGALSAAVGFINGFFGGGGGMLLVPLLEKGMSVSVKSSHATAIAIILPMSAASAVAYVANGYFEWLPVIAVSAACIVGGIVGALLLKKLPAQLVGVIFALMMLGVGVKLAFFGG